MLRLALAALAAACLDPAPACAADLDPAAIQRALAGAHAKYASLAEGKNADYIPALAKVPSKLFGIALVTTSSRS